MNLLYKENKHSGIAPVACWIHTLEHVYNHRGMQTRNQKTLQERSS